MYQFHVALKLHWYATQSFDTTEWTAHALFCFYMFKSWMQLTIFFKWCSSVNDEGHIEVRFNWWRERIASYILEFDMNRSYLMESRAIMYLRQWWWKTEQCEHLCWWLCSWWINCRHTWLCLCTSGRITSLCTTESAIFICCCFIKVEANLGFLKLYFADRVCFTD